MTNGGVNVAALGFGGIDTSGIVSSLVAIEQQPYNLLQTKQQSIGSASATISAFSSTLSALKTTATALSSASSFVSMSAKSSDTSIATTTGTLASPGQWSVSVANIAQEQRTLSNTNSSNTTALGISGNLAISLGNGTSATIALESTDTLGDVTDKISSAGLRVQASMVYDGSQYRLMVSGLDTGDSNAITFDETGLTSDPAGYSLGLSDSLNTVQAAKNANLTIGGIPVSSATNQITGAIPGVTLAVTQKTTSPATISIGSDPSSVQSNVQAFVNAYNNVVGSGHSIAGFGTQKSSNTLLQGDRGVRSTLDQLGSLFAAPVAGTTGAYTTLASVGISLNNDGTLTLDSTKLTSALSSDPSSVERLFVTDTSNGSQGIMNTFGSTIDALSSGSGSALQAEITAFSTRNTQIGKQMTAMQQRLASYQTQLQSQFTQMNTMLAQYKQMSNAITSSSSSK
jgi:flagellar hook-associated protein 2